MFFSEFIVGFCANLIYTRGEKKSILKVKNTPTFLISRHGKQKTKKVVLYIDTSNYIIMLMFLRLFTLSLSVFQRKCFGS